MKSKIIIVILIPILLGGCSSQLCLQKKTNKLIKELHEEADTVYLYSSAFNNFNLMWYHKNNFIYCFEVKCFHCRTFIFIYIKFIKMMQIYCILLLQKSQ